MIMNPSFYRTIHNEKQANNRVKSPWLSSGNRLIRIVVIALTAALLFTSFLLITTNAASGTVEEASVSETVVVVTAGDTLWDIASHYSDGHKDIGKLVFLLKERNGLETADIRPGQTIVIPEW
ncbi:LysM peptidoglycan-binding domain-containing protein [Paenibacillus thailandensis]|uniref:LysM peptidoglycan-binding domain-containing protein n=1 Tax=Paenibacillus thailandensis TaxID=393250 RepID=A0ABW5QTJ5_9BACL